MTKRPRVEVEEGIRVRSNTRGVEDPVATFDLSIPVREVESGISMGFRSLWGSMDVDGDTLEVFSGAGMGSAWASISFRGKTYAIGAHDLVASLLQHLGIEEVDDDA